MDIADNDTKSHDIYIFVSVPSILMCYILFSDASNMLHILQPRCTIVFEEKVGSKCGQWTEILSVRDLLVMEMEELQSIFVPILCSL
jgi:hypothetical protein